MFFLKGTTTTVAYFFLLINNFIFQEIAAQIVGGQDTAIEHFPYMVSIRYNFDHFCGGAIISQRHILTAAHCITHRPDITRYSVVAGSTRSNSNVGSHHTVSHATVHPGFIGRTPERRNSTNLHNDIAVIALRTIIQFSPSIQKINLPLRNTRVSQRVSFTGWGVVNEIDRRTASILQRADLTTIENAVCSQRLRSENVEPLTNEQICAFERAGVGTCHKDSGGPLAANNELIGILSFGIPCARGFPDVFTRVFAYKAWIEEVMATT